MRSRPLILSLFIVLSPKALFLVGRDNNELDISPNFFMKTFVPKRQAMENHTPWKTNKLTISLCIARHYFFTQTKNRHSSILYKQWLITKLISNNNFIECNTVFLSFFFGLHCHVRDTVRVMNFFSAKSQRTQKQILHWIANSNYTLIYAAILPTFSREEGRAVVLSILVIALLRLFAGFLTLLCLFVKQ